MERASVVDTLPVYIFDEINRLKYEARVKGRDVIDFGMGNPDIPTPPAVVEKLRQAVLDPRNHRYSVSRGIPGVRRELAYWYKRKYDVELDPDQEVLLTLGAKEGFNHLIQAITAPGEHVMVTSPCYPIHRFAVQLSRAVPVLLPADPESMLCEAQKALNTINPRPRTLIISYPNNPTTACVDLDFFSRVVALARENDLLVIHDFAYADLVYDNYRAPSILQVPGAKETALEFYSLTKGYSMAGWRVGFCSGHAPVLNKLRRLKSYMDYGMFQPIQIAAAVALRDCDTEVDRICRTYGERRDCLIRNFDQAGWSIEPPRGTLFVWAPIPDSVQGRLNSLDFARFLLAEAEVAVAPGIGFGEAGEGWVRLALVENEHRIKQAARNIRRALSKG
ncbi:MAG: aminotransferase class I/II-fold pyridoxal phosphate-dependent enzyme [Acidobacteria bacterium]|nr:MAG: aminotransferase class I/II-fold pyridoxal phosphate-dependent enzyme [Acidobacteriota bacterium]